MLSSALYDPLPTDVINEIVIRTSIDTIVSLCCCNEYLYSKLSDCFFWINYLNHKTVCSYNGDPQDRLHSLLIELAREGNWSLFKFIWEADLGLIKENRSLGDGYEAAFKNGKKKCANMIWEINPSWKLKRGDYWNYDGDKDFIDVVLNLELAAEKNDISPYMGNLSRELRAYIPNTLSYSKNFDFIVEVRKIHFREHLDSVDFSILTQRLLSKGEFALVERIAEYKHPHPQLDDKVYRERINWFNALSSSRDDSFQYIQSKYKDIPVNLILRYITPYIGEIGIKIGSSSLLYDYANRHPEDHDSLLESFKTLPSKEFYELYKNTAKNYNMDERDMFFGYLEFYGYDYLLSLFKDGVLIS